MQTSTNYAPGPTAIADNLETLKSEYLEEYKKSFPRLKALAAAIRQHEVKLTEDDDIEGFWRISGDLKIDYELCQLASDIDGYDRFFWDCVNKDSNPVVIVKEIESPPLSDVAEIANVAEDVMLNLFGYESILNCVVESMPQVGDRHVIDASDAIRTITKLISKESTRLEVELIRQLKKLTR